MREHYRDEPYRGTSPYYTTAANSTRRFNLEVVTHTGPGLGSLSAGMRGTVGPYKAAGTSSRH